MIKEIEDLAFKYGVDFEEALKIFESVSCCKKQLKAALENSEHVSWSELDDLGLNDIHSPEYKHLVQTKGKEEVERRKRFLGLDKEAKVVEDSGFGMVNSTSQVE